jgi:hypothetical protein
MAVVIRRDRSCLHRQRHVRDRGYGRIERSELRPSPPVTGPCRAGEVLILGGDRVSGDLRSSADVSSMPTGAHSQHFALSTPFVDRSR